MYTTLLLSLKQINIQDKFDRNGHAGVTQNYCIGAVVRKFACKEEEIKMQFHINIRFLFLTDFWTLLASNAFLQLDFPPFPACLFSFLGILMHLHITRCKPLRYFRFCFMLLTKILCFLQPSRTVTCLSLFFFAMLGCPCCVLIYFIWCLSDGNGKKTHYPTFLKSEELNSNCQNYIFVSKL